ncbi:OPT family oligopeptide transporter [Wielerella bovis]|uniref:OPT family oligopeptide transporter n=1 Tax=Wielerella bovis TaxID=2917790 RepID=UPI002019FED2|nr:oligopeptide transporter, OPT family [Wielerella bovis]ULJ64730.1 oligopeptide transporter, OPT family [Wielerella bovis]ULJ67002.1 oligopeptide transporter, OPT family [Wielerella bovis]
MSQMQDSYAHYRELTLRGTILGALITVIFTASNVYLGLKVGLTFASSIPAAVISMAILKFFPGSNILENNMVQTQASAAGTLSAVIFVLPGLLMMGYWNGFPFWQTMLICATGGILGVIFTIPLRYVMVVNSPLPYPEGVAAAEILKAGNHDDEKRDEGAVADSGAKEILAGGVVAGVLSFATNGLRVVADSASYWFKGGNAIFQIPMGFSLALLGAGYLVGIVGGMAILVGIVFTWFIAVPYFTAAAPMPADADMVGYALDVWRTKARFIGVGTIGIAAIWTLISLSKPMMEGMRQSLIALKNPQAAAQLERVDRDMSPKSMIQITLAIILVILAIVFYFVQAVSLPMGLTITLVLVCTLLAVAIGFFVAAACGYMAGLVGSSSSPISGIGIISVVTISLVLMTIGKASGIFDMPNGEQFLTALTIYTASIVLAVATISNDNLQDLKTGYLVKATPWRQQVALLIGCVVGAAVIAPTLEMLYNAYGFTGAMPREGMDAAQALSAPQATLMTTIAKGIFSGNLEWTYIFCGIGLGIAIILADAILKKSSNNRFALPALAVGMGIYLPPAVNMPIVIGAIVAYWMANKTKRQARQLAEQEAKAMEATVERRGTLFSAGLIVGESLVGVMMAFIIAASVTSGGSDAPLAIQLENWGTAAEILGLLAFIGGAIIFVMRTLRPLKSTQKNQ